MKNKKRRVLPLAIALVAIVAISGVAYAYWSSTGTGTGSATTGTSVALQAAQTNTVTMAALVPGGSAEVDITVHNPATFSQSFNAVAIAVTAATGGCNILWFSTTPPTISGPVILAGGATTATYTTGSVSMTETGTNQDVCKNSTLTLTFTVS